MSVPTTFEGSRSVRPNPMLAVLEYGIGEGRPAIVKQCIDDGVDVNAVTPGSRIRPLELALKMRNVSIMRLLLEGGADKEGRNAHTSTVLIEASRYGHLECVQLLVEHGANLYACDVHGKTCLNAALEREHYSIARYLLERDSRAEVVRPSNGLCLLQHLILSDDAASILNLKHCKADLNDSCPDDPGLLVFATRFRENEALKVLLEAGADPNIGTTDSDFALHEAVRLENVDAVKTLLEHGASPKLTDRGDVNPFEIAIKRSCLPMLRLLLDYEADIENSFPFLRTPLIEACKHGFLEGVQLLVERGANLRARSADGRTCLLLAVEYEKHSVVDFLLQQDICEVDGIGRDGLSALHHAVLLNNVDMMCKLIQKQANFNTQNHDGEVPAFLAAKHDKLNLLCILLEAGADPNIRTKDGDSVLQEAVRHGNLEAVKLLLQYGADKDR